MGWCRAQPLHGAAIGRQRRYKAYNLDLHLNKSMTSTMATTYERERSDSFCSKQLAAWFCLKHASSSFPVTVFVSWMWEAYFIFLLPWMFNFKYPISITLMGWLFLILLGILPAVMLRQGVTKGRPARVLFWFLTISSEAIVCVLVLVLSDNRSWVPRFRVPGSGLGTIPIEILLPWISFIIAVVVSVVLVSLELAVKKEEFSKLVQSNSESEGVVIEEVIISSTSKTNLEGTNLRCPKCGTNAGIEAYYNNSDNICYMTYCTKCVHEHGLYVRLETDEEETKGAKSLAEAQKRKQESEAKKMQEKCKVSVEFTKVESRAKSKDSNPVSRVLKGRSHYEVLGVPEGSTDEEIRQAFRQLARVVHPDKNRDPRAGEAFAKVQQAFSGLSKEA